MKVIFIFLALFSGTHLPAQKPPVTNTSYKSWELLFNYNISGNGKYVWYTYGSEVTGVTLVVRAINSNYKKIFTGVSEPTFTPDNMHLLFISSEGLGILPLGTSNIQYIPRITHFLLPEAGNRGLIAARKQDTLLIKDLQNKREQQYTGIHNTRFNRQGDVLVLKSKDGLVWLDLQTNKQKNILHTANAGNVTFDHAGTGLAFTTGNHTEAAVYYYKANMDSALLLTRKSFSNLKPGLVPVPLDLYFSQDDRLIFFRLTNEKAVVPRDSLAITDKVSIWDYRDSRLHSQTSRDPYTQFSAVIPVNGGAVTQLENADSSLRGSPGNRYALVHNVTNEEDAYWNSRQIPGYDLISLTDGKRINVIRSPQPVAGISLSPHEDYVTWFDPRSRHYFSFEIGTGITRNVSSGIPAALVNSHISRKEVLPYGVAGWLDNDVRLLIYDEFDIWQVDPKGQHPPLNITNGFGRQHQTILHIVYPQQLPRLSLNDRFLITCLDSDMRNGFMFIKAGFNSAVSPDNMQPYVYHFPALTVFEPPPPIKAKKADIYVLQRQSAGQAPNLVVTADFTSFQQLSDLQPQKAYNWLRATLVRWPVSKGITGTGILYKPENFDSTRKYPVIFHYYEEKSKGLNIFPSVRLSTGQLNIAWYVSNGYLVFVPDIHRPTGENGSAILNTVISAAKYLSGLPYVNVNKMGLQGHSFGGYETNYLVTHTDLFAAAQASAAPAELFGLHGGTGFGGRSYHYISELGQLNQGVAPWQDPSLYLQHSPVLSVDKVTTPLLLMHNRDDSAVPFSQSVALFTALRRLEKPVWLLEYDGEGHVLFDPKCQLDFNVKQQEFFDHYLRDKAAPGWMKRLEK